MKKIKFCFRNGSNVESEVLEYVEEPTQEEFEQDMTEFFFDRCLFLGIEAWTEEIED